MPQNTRENECPEESETTLLKSSFIAYGMLTESRCKWTTTSNCFRTVASESYRQFLKFNFGCFCVATQPSADTSESCSQDSKFKSSSARFCRWPSAASADTSESCDLKSDELEKSNVSCARFCRLPSAASADTSESCEHFEKFNESCARFCKPPSSASADMSES